MMFCSSVSFIYFRKISGPHVCGDALDIEPSTLNIVTGSWRHYDPLEVCISHIYHAIFELTNQIVYIK